MKNQHLKKGKKLTKKELKSIAGGRLVCSTSSGGCSQINTGCIEPQCQPGKESCMYGNGIQICIKYAYSCIESQCRPDGDGPIL